MNPIATGEIQILANHTALISHAGKVCPIADSADPIRDSNGQLVRASEEYLRSVINNVPALIALVDAQQRFAPTRRSQWLQGAKDAG